MLFLPLGKTGVAINGMSKPMTPPMHTDADVDRQMVHFLIRCSSHDT